MTMMGFILLPRYYHRWICCITIRRIITMMLPLPESRIDNIIIIMIFIFIFITLFIYFHFVSFYFILSRCACFHHAAAAAAIFITMIFRFLFIFIIFRNPVLFIIILSLIAATPYCFLDFYLFDHRGGRETEEGGERDGCFAASFSTFSFIAVAVIAG